MDVNIVQIERMTITGTGDNVVPAIDRVRGEGFGITYFGPLMADGRVSDPTRFLLVAERRYQSTESQSAPVLMPIIQDSLI